MSSSTELKNVHFACKGKQIAHFAKILAQTGFNGLLLFPCLLIRDSITNWQHCQKVDNIT